MKQEKNFCDECGVLLGSNSENFDLGFRRRISVNQEKKEVITLSFCLEHENIFIKKYIAKYLIEK